MSRLEFKLTATNLKDIDCVIEKMGCVNASKGKDPQSTAVIVKLWVLFHTVISILLSSRSSKFLLLLLWL